MKNDFLFLSVTAILLCGACFRAPVRNVNSRSTKEAARLLNFLYEISGRYVLTGQHNYISAGSVQTERAAAFTGETPVIWGSDFSFCYQGKEPQHFQHCGPLNLTMPGESVRETGLAPEEARERLVQSAIQKHREGFIITLMWHACPPGLGDCCDGNSIWTWDRRPSQERWDELVTDGTELNRAWKAHADVIAGYLKQLRDARVPVLWRPFHEMNGIWFWWCNKPGANGFKRLWIMMYDYYVNHHQLDNLIWVWNTNAPRNKAGDEAGAYEDFWPGSEYVDVLAADVYHSDWKQSHHDDLLKLAAGKPIALGEVGDIPSPQVLSRQKHWVWFMPWFSNMYRPGPGEAVKETYHLPQVLTKDEITVDQDGFYRVKSD